jgi:hypothetical protein
MIDAEKAISVLEHAKLQHPDLIHYFDAAILALHEKLAREVAHEQE